MFLDVPCTLSVTLIFSREIIKGLKNSILPIRTCDKGPKINLQMFVSNVPWEKGKIIMNFLHKKMQKQNISINF